MPAWKQLVDFAFEQAGEVWAKILAGAAIAAVSWYLGRRRAVRTWRDRVFLDRLNFSLTSIREGTLQVRTLIECPSADVFPNRAAIEAVNAAAAKTTPNNPLLPLLQADRWYYLNAVLNEVAEHYSVGVLRRDLGHDVKSATYLICLTNEKAGEIRTQKIRALVVRKDLLMALPEKQPKLESPNHVSRWTTLQTMKVEYERDPSQFLTVELCL